MVGRERVAFGESLGRGQSGILTVIPTTNSGIRMPPLWWRVGVQLRLGIVPEALPAKCPNCQKANNLDHALGSGKRGGCGWARGLRHNEVVEYLKRMAEEVGLPVQATSEPAVGKIGGDNKDTKCDGIIRGLETPQRDAWIDGMVMDTGAPSHQDKPPMKALIEGEDEKFEKHGRRVAIANGADFVPIVCSVYGTLAPKCQRTIKTITERMTDKSKLKDKKDLARMLHHNRARFQAAIWRANAMCVVGRRRQPKKKEDGEGTEWRMVSPVEMLEEFEEKMGRLEGGMETPWLCVAEDARAGEAF
jgi:hypothetical protein